MASCNTCAYGHNESLAGSQHCIGCVDCSKFVLSDDGKLREYDELVKIRDAYEGLMGRKRFAVVTQAYINCPSCDGADGRAQIRTFDNLHEIIEMMRTEGCDREVTASYDMHNDVEDPLYVTVNTGNHCVRSIKVSFGDIAPVLSDNDKLVRGPWHIYPRGDGKGTVRDRDDDLLTDEDCKERLKLI